MLRADAEETLRLLPPPPEGPSMDALVLTREDGERRPDAPDMDDAAAIPVTDAD